MQLPWDLDALAGLTRHGWVDAPAPLSALSALARELGLKTLHVKRDDQLPALGGGSKLRKLDVLLAAEPYRSAPGWHSVGALGSGQLVSLACAATALDKQLHAHLFRTELSAHGLENLACTASQARYLYDEHQRWRLLFKPALWGEGEFAGLPVVPPGTSNALGTLGLVRAGLELGEDVRLGHLPAPDQLYLPLGSGGSAVGLAIGCALAGLPTVIRAIAVVERPLATRRRLKRLTQETLAALSRLGWSLPSHFEPRGIEVMRTALGAGYARATRSGLEAGKRFASHGIPSEPHYSQKALAALLQAARAHSGEHVLFWNTCRGQLPAPADAWEERLPDGLRRYLNAPSAARRRWLLGGVGFVGAALTLGRLRLEPLPAWNGCQLSAGEARVLRAAAEVILPAEADLAASLLGADRYLATLPEAQRTELSLLLHALEQAPLLLGVAARRFSTAPASEREATLSELCARGGTFVAAYHGVRDLCFVGHYQQAAAWAALGYTGPITAPAEPTASSLLAPPGALPPGASRVQR